MKHITEYEHIIWDWNGTLFDDAWLCVECMNKLLSTYGLPLLSLESYAALFDFPVRNYYERLGFDFEQVPFEMVGTEFIRLYEQRRHECRLQERALDILQFVKNHGHSQSVLSAYQQHSLEAVIAYFSLSTFFIRLCGLQDHYAHSKLENARTWVCSMDCHPGNVLLIGDTLHDYEVARDTEIECVLVVSGHQSRERLERTGCPVFDSLEHVMRMWHVASASKAGSSCTPTNKMS